MTNDEIIRRVAKMPATGPDADVVLAAREWVDGLPTENTDEKEVRKNGKI